MGLLLALATLAAAVAIGAIVVLWWLTDEEEGLKW